MADRRALRFIVAKSLRGEGWPLAWNEISASRRRPWLEMADMALAAIEDHERNQSMKLVEGWRSCWRWWSVQLHLVASSVLMALQFAPVMPAEVQKLIPQPYGMIATALWTLLGIYARVAKQR